MNFKQYRVLPGVALNDGLYIMATDIHKAKGLKVENTVKKLLRAAGYGDACIFADGIANEVARSERAKTRKRLKKAEKQKATMDIFSDV